MVDLATIGYGVQTQGLVQGEQALSHFAAHNRAMMADIDQQWKKAASATGDYRDALTATEKVQDRHARSIKNVAENLSFEMSQRQRSAREQHIHNQLRSASVNLASAEGQAIAGLAARHYDLTQATEKAAQSISTRGMFKLMAREANLVGGPLGQLISQMGVLTVGTQRLSLATTGTVLGFAAVAAGAAASVAAFYQFEQTQKRVQNILTATGGRSGQTPESLEALTKQLAAPGTQSLSDIRAAEEEMLKFGNVTQAVFADAMKAAQNLSNTWGKDLKTSAEVLGRSIQNPIDHIQGLRDAGVTVTAPMERFIVDLYKAGRTSEQAAVQIGLVQEQMGGATANSATAMAAAVGRVTISFNLMLEKVGQTISKSYDLVSVLDRLVAVMERISGMKSFQIQIPGISEETRRKLNAAADYVLNTDAPASGGARQLPGNVKAPSSEGAEWGGRVQPGQGPYPGESLQSFLVRGGSSIDYNRARPASERTDQAPLPPITATGGMSGGAAAPASASARVAASFNELTPDQVKNIAATNEQLERQTKLYGMNEGELAKFLSREQAHVATEGKETEATRKAAEAINAKTNAMLATRDTKQITDGIKMQTASLEIEAQTFGMSASAAAAYRIEQEALARERIKGVSLGPEREAQIKAEAAAYQTASQAVEKYRNAKQAADAVSSSFADGLFDWATKAKTASQAIDDITKSIGRMIVQAGFAGQGPMAGLFGTNVSGGLFGSVLKPLFGGSSQPGMTGPAPPTLPTTNLGYGGPTAGVDFDVGGYTGQGGKYQPAGIVHRNEYVFNSEAVDRLGVGFLERLRGYAGGGHVAPASSSGMGGGGLTVQNNWTIENRSGAPVRVEEDQPDGRGGRRGRVVIEELVGSTIRPGSSAAEAMHGMLGTQQRPRKRGA